MHPCIYMHLQVGLRRGRLAPACGFVHARSGQKTYQVPGILIDGRILIDGPKLHKSDQTAKGWYRKSTCIRNNKY